jgi:hypothetical protein
VIADRRSNLLADLDAFLGEHRDCGELASVVECDVVWMATARHSLVIHRQVLLLGGAPSPRRRYRIATKSWERTTKPLLRTCQRRRFSGALMAILTR